ncbi:hypothetical protein [Streptomyces sp. NPDC047453]|uniref:hypothetical protein n=1 Tax=Streptomyces sp. NPDC047453 TaxID=3154812 RepID=UPI0033CCECB7
MNTVSGHRDGYATLCPGKTLYSALPGIRTAAGQSRYTRADPPGHAAAPSPIGRLVPIGRGGGAGRRTGVA